MVVGSCAVCCRLDALAIQSWGEEMLPGLGCSEVGMLANVSLRDTWVRL
jgi:hypothetical protein